MTIKLTIPEIPPSNNKFMGRGSRKYQVFTYQDEKKKWEWLVEAAIKDKPKKPFEKAEVKIIYLWLYMGKWKSNQEMYSKEEDRMTKKEWENCNTCWTCKYRKIINGHPVVV